MDWKSKIFEKGSQLLDKPEIMRWVTDDRVMKVAEGLMDAPERIKAAVNILRNGYELPNVDPALDEERPQKSSSRNARADDLDGDPGVKTPTGSSDMEESMSERRSLATIGGKDIFDKAFKFSAADNARKRGIYPFFRPLDFSDGPEAQIDGRRVIMFGSNNYLGLTTHPKVREAARNAIDRFGTSMTGSRLVNGSMKLHEEFEEKLAAWYGKESALVFTTGYQVNLATLSALLSNKQSVAVIDRNVHASLYDGVRLGMATGARQVRYKHNDPESLDQALSKLEDGEGALVCSPPKAKSLISIRSCPS